MTSVSAGAYSDMPLVLLHLIEYLDVDYEIDVAELNDRWGRTAAADEWSQLVIKETREDVELLTAAPATGVWRLDDDGHARFAGAGTTGTRSATRARRSTCRCSARASTATRARTWACSSPARGCRRTATS